MLGHWPWLVNVNNGCTGTIIHPNWVITAKHCDGPHNTIAYGHVYKFNMKSIKVNQSFVPDEKCRYASDECLKGKDIALFQLEEPIPDSPNSRPICLTKHISEKWGDLEAAAGWGTYLIPVGQGYQLESSPHCREVDIPMRAIEQGYCDTVPADDKHELCAGTWNHGTTPGDSGGPTMALINDTWYLHGITSRGVYLQTNDDPQMFRDQGVYTDATSFCDWIEEKTDGEVQCQ
uniref:Peptidase S1 domain-containing protein n=2 Tax=Panagrolaimus sp. JU765 TaxID=591449 RepID=A0AC34RFI2_9BILA